MPDYPSNISRAQFALIQPDLENFRKHTRPRRYDLYDVFNAILYSLTTVQDCAGNFQWVRNRVSLHASRPDVLKVPEG